MVRSLRPRPAHSPFSSYCRRLGGLILAACLPACASFDVSAPGGLAAAPDSGGAPDASPGAPDAAQMAPDAPLAAPFCDADDPDLVACYTFDGQSGQDESMYGHDLDLFGVNFQAGIAGAALSVDESSSAATAESPALDVDALTIELWIRPGELPADSRVGLIDNDQQYGMFLFANGQLRCTAGTPTSFQHDLAPDVWTHVACTHDGAEATIWVDGVARESNPAPPLETGGTSGLTVGMNNPSGDNFVGAVDSVRVWRVARAPEDLCAAAGENCPDP